MYYWFALVCYLVLAGLNIFCGKSEIERWLVDPTSGDLSLAIGNYMAAGWCFGLAFAHTSNEIVRRWF
jgi:hypothetical protein